MFNKIKLTKFIWCLTIIVELAVILTTYFEYNSRESIELNYTQDDLVYDNGESGFYLDTSYDYDYVSTPEIVLPGGVHARSRI